jgi:hypothetical protein
MTAWRQSGAQDGFQQLLLLAAAAAAAMAVAATVATAVAAVSGDCQKLRQRWQAFRYTLCTHLAPGTDPEQQAVHMHIS